MLGVGRIYNVLSEVKGHVLLMVKETNDYIYHRKVTIV
jgi:hypothetical protein